MTKLQNGAESSLGSFHFAQAFIPLMQANGGTMIFTGATMAMRAGAKFSGMAPSMFARRAIAQASHGSTSRQVA